MQMINALVKTQRKSAVCNYWPELQISRGQLNPPDPAFPTPWECGHRQAAYTRVPMLPTSMMW